MVVDRPVMATTKTTKGKTVAKCGFIVLFSMLMLILFISKRLQSQGRQKGSSAGHTVAQRTEGAVLGVIPPAQDTEACS